MLEENLDFQRVLDLLEDPILDKPLARVQYYNAFITALEKDTEISPAILDRVLGLCVSDLNNDKKSVIQVLRIIKSILKRIKTGIFPAFTNLLPSILAILNILKSLAQLHKVENMQTICFEVLMSYPNDVLIQFTACHTHELLDVCSMFCHQDIPVVVRKLSYELLLKILEILPSEENKIFVKKNISTWFSKVYPAAIASVGVHTPDHKEPLLLMEILTSELHDVEYLDNPEWLAFLEWICNPTKYPKLMTQMLTTGNHNWHRLWIIFSKLLKNQITKTTVSMSSPINAMLPVVELAFKMDVPNRCQAFKCWSALIENFAMELNEVYINKRLKLLFIPLKSNNAKVEDNALAKLNTWWQLVQCYQTKLDKFSDKIIVPFLHFCFGRHSGMSPKSSCIPGLLTVKTKRKSVEAFVELTGHLCCSGCVNMPKLNHRVFTKSILVDHWDDWVYSLKVAITSLNEDVELETRQIECVWKSFFATVAELPDNNIRKDLFHGLLSVLEGLMKLSETNAYFPKHAFQLLCSLFGEEKIEVLFKTKLEEENMPIFRIMSLLLMSTQDVFYRSCDTMKIVVKLKPLADYILKSHVAISLLMKNFPVQNILYLLIALSETAYQTQYEDIEGLTALLFWPLKPTNILSDMAYATQIWVSLTTYMYPKLKTNMKDKLRSALSRDITESNIQLKLNLCMAILKYELNNDSVSGYIKNVEIFMTLTNTCEHKHVGENLKMLTDTVISIFTKVNDNSYSPLLSNALTVTKKLLNLMVLVLEDANEAIVETVSSYENLLHNVEVIFRNKKYASVSTNLLDELLTNAPLLHKHPSLQKCVINVLKAYSDNSKKYSNSLIRNKVNDFLNSFESKMHCDKEIQKLSEAETSNTNNAKKDRKRETTIVNKVVDNGEEFAVIKSNWKFNPRKLTENQKEKFQRKREDIPALYQDLSQSQDEFKLSTWKTESQDASSTNSKSTSNSFANISKNSDNVSEILKNMPSTDVVPKIIENIISGKNDADINTKEETRVTTNKLKQIQDPKSPRMALKDRVFRNVRNLIEKSSVQRETKDLSESLIHVENAPKTPTSKTVDNTHLVNTAPAIMGAERPSRLKRKPKKFEDVQLISLKRSRRSDSQCDTQNVSQTDQGKNENINVPSPINPENVETPSSNQNDDSNENPTVPKSKEDKNDDKDTMNENTIKCDSIKNSPESEMPDKNQNKEMEIEKESSSNVADLHDTTSSEIPNEKNCIPKESQTCDAKIDSVESQEGSIPCKNTTKDINDVPSKDITVVESIEIFSKTDSPIVNKSDSNTQNPKNINKGIKTPKSSKKQEIVMEPRSGKRNSSRKSRIEKELAIDTVEGHPFLKIQTEKRITRKNLNNPVLNNSRRKNLTEKFNKSKNDNKTPLKTQTASNKKKEKDILSPVELDTEPVAVDVSPESSEKSDELPFSEDVIESSQDSSITTISIKTSKPVLKKIIVVASKIPLAPLVDPTPLSENSQDMLSIDKTFDIDNKDDTELPQNKTAVNKTDMDLTENMDTQSLDLKAIEDQNSSDVIIINDDEVPIVIGSETQEIADADTQLVDGPSETQEIADADTQPADVPSETQEIAEADTQLANSSNFNEMSLESQIHPTIDSRDDGLQVTETDVNTANEITTTINESMNMSMTPEDENTVSSPFKDEEQRKKDFLDNTLEISPIKTMSPVRDKKSPSPETSSDYVLIKLSSPVQSNGEPFEKCDSPEIFTEDKISPDKRDLSPPREENTVNNTSPSSSLSLKKNRPQVRSGGRAAQMLGLCVPDRLQTIKNSERLEPEEPKKNSPSNTPARRNLRILYNSVGGDSSENSEETEESENFLKFKRVLPTFDSSPAGPILKRKIAEITDDATISPASKRKRVSFHDPPVSTTVSVQKYIEPLGIRSPQNSLLKRQERQNLRSQATLKSPRRLESVFKLDTVLTKAVESFTEPDPPSSDITQSMSLDETPALEIVKNSDLNDVDPICPDLVDCYDRIDEIATELSSATMKTMFLKEIEGKIATIGDLAKMTELEVNRLCIKAPKVKIAKKVLEEYAEKRRKNNVKPIEIIEILEDDNTPDISNNSDNTIVKKDIEVQVTIANNDVEMQTVPISTSVGCVQTDALHVFHASVQTNESGAKSTREVITSCLAERPDFIDNLSECLEESAKLKIAENMSESSITDVFMKNITSANSKSAITRILQVQNVSNSMKGQTENDLLFLQNYLSDRFESRDLILFCSQLLSKIHSKPS